MCCRPWSSKAVPAQNIQRWFRCETLLVELLQQLQVDCMNICQIKRHKLMCALPRARERLSFCIIIFLVSFICSLINDLWGRFFDFLRSANSFLFGRLFLHTPGYVQVKRVNISRISDLIVRFLLYYNVFDSRSRLHSLCSAWSSILGNLPCK